jgi:septum formation topological specificity factor MinE
MISHLMIENNPLKIDVEAIRKGCLDKVEEMRRELMRAVDDWVNIMRSHLMQSIGFE